MDSKGKRATCDFVNLICGVDVGDVSMPEAQCECLIGAIIVCLYFDYNSKFYAICLCLVILFELVRMEMKMKYVTKLE